MTELFLDAWKTIDPFELRLVLEERVGGPGQYDGRSTQPMRLYLPLAGAASQIELTFDIDGIVSIQPGLTFDADHWAQVQQAIESLLFGAQKIEREYSFSRFRVDRAWHGAGSEVQISPPPDDALRTSWEIADHPFILEFPIQESDFAQVNNHRRMKCHHRLTLLLNVLLVGRISFLPTRPEYFWASVPREDRDGARPASSDRVSRCSLQRCRSTMAGSTS